MEALADINWPYLLISAFAGGAFGAALGALPAFVFTGIAVILGETASVVGEVLGPELGGNVAAELGIITGTIGFGSFFGPHISFAGGAAAAAYAAQKGYMQTGSAYHEAKNIAYAFGTKLDVLVVGGLFGVFGAVVTAVSGSFSLPWDPIALAVVLSAFAHRLAFGYSIIGSSDHGLLDMTPFEREETRTTTEGAVPDHADAPGDRLAVEPWLAHQYHWPNVAFIGLVAGLLGAYAAIETGSAFLGYGISAASLFFLNLGVEKIPVTHHITLMSSTMALAVLATEGGALSGVSDLAALLLGGGFGVVCALIGELFQRLFYAHGDTHVDPPAAAVLVGSVLMVLFYFAGLIGTTTWVPVP